MNLVNTLPNGKIQTEFAIKHHARPLKEKHNIEFKFHTLRHTYGTTLALLNTPEHILLNQMGHSKRSTTHRYYLAVSEDGIVTATGIGTTFVTATNSNGMKSNCLIYVYGKANNIVLNENSILQFKFKHF